LFAISKNEDSTEFFTGIVAGIVAGNDTGDLIIAYTPLSVNT